ncbi:MAG: hypothetical protein ACOYO0_13535 [Sandarakinorhabdus sp.]
MSASKNKLTPMQCLSKTVIAKLPRQTYQGYDDNGDLKIFERDFVSQAASEGIYYGLNTPGLNNFCDRDIEIVVRYNNTSIPQEKFVISKGATDVHTHYIYPIVASAKWAN